MLLDQALLEDRRRDVRSEGRNRRLGAKAARRRREDLGHPLAADAELCGEDHLANPWATVEAEVADEQVALPGGQCRDREPQDRACLA